MPFGHHEVVHHAERPRVDHAGLHQRSVPCNLVEDEPHGGDQADPEGPQGSVGLDLGMGGERHAFEALAPGLEAPPGERLAVEHTGRPALPQGEQLTVMVEDRDVGGVEVVGAAHRGRAGDRGPEPGIEPAARRQLPGELRRVHHAPAVGECRPVEAERLHHAVPVEPVAVAQTEPLVYGRAVAVQGAAELRGQAPLDPGRASEAIGTGALPAEQHRMGCETRGEVGGPVAAARRSPRERPHERHGQVRETARPREQGRAEQLPAAPRVHRSNPPHPDASS